ncbi:MAG: hydantoinase/oxoprolinase family protein [Caulobacteraceae bacterium]|nr:hydantoinase/oxoprolinase family protein [Caulobacteraceae bacterium]
MQHPVQSPSGRPQLRVASDVGGTFTDLVFCEIDPTTGAATSIRTVKSDTTPPDFEVGVLNAMAKGQVAAQDMAFFAHGSTVVINAVTERKGVKTGLITTKGFRDVLEIARGNRPDLFNFNFRKPKPFVERHLRLEIPERTNHKGEITLEADLSGLPAILDHFRAEGVRAVAIAFLHAYANPLNEACVAAEVRRLWPEVSVLASHEISREWREYERTSTVVLSAYVHPIAETYIENLERKLAEAGSPVRPYMMQSNGGIATVEAAKRNPIAMVESGPASGIFAAAFLGRMIGAPNLIVLDVGGTTAKCALIEQGEVKVTTEYYVERDRKTPGYPIQTPVSEIVEIGNGGGSIAWADAGGKLHVGPQSAGASPGPAAYGRGGEKPTTTDANLVLGRIDPSSFVGGELEPDWAAVDRAFSPLGAELGLSRAELARGIVRIANANMVNALRLVSTNKGYDPRDFVLMAFGGGGGMHAVALAEDLRVPRVIVPVNSSVFSSWGMLLTDLRRDYIQTRLLPLTADQAPGLRAAFDDLRRQALADFGDDAAGGVGFEHFVDLRYQGQEHTVKVPVPTADDGTIDVPALIARFHAAHEKRFTYRLDNPVQLVTFHAIATVAVPKPALPKRAVTGAGIEAARLPSREVDFDRHGVHLAAIYDGSRLEPGMTLAGPAVVQEPSVTLVISPGHVLTVDEYGDYVIDLSFERD